MLQNASLCILFCLISYILAKIAFKSEMTFFARNGFSARNDFSTRNGFFFARNGFFFGRNCFAAKNTFVKFEVAFWPKMFFWLEMFFFQMNLPYLSKYWKVWLAFDGWNTVNSNRQVTGMVTGENFAFFIYRHFVEIL